MAAPDFFQFHCTNDDTENCSTCPRDFVIPTGAIEGIFKDAGGKAVILINGIHYCPGPHCVNRLRFIETSSDWASIVDLLNGELEDMGDIVMTDQDNIPKG